MRRQQRADVFAAADAGYQTVQALHGLVSCAEWTGIRLSTLLKETGIDPAAKWLIAEGADSPHLSRSVPVKKALDDAMIALYQNGERLMPGNGYPMRLLLPGHEGNMNVKFLRRIKLVDQPALSMYEARTYSQILPDGKAYRFYFLPEVKSFITSPCHGQALKGPGPCEISGIAYSGTGRIEKVMVSADGGQSWVQAALQEPVLINSKAFARFRLPWRWDGGKATLQSRAWDEAGNVQPTRAEFVAVRDELAKPGAGTDVPQSALQFDRQLGRRDQRGSQACLRLTARSPLRVTARSWPPRFG
jgi:sulfane dehydrogenase subunit SoxC